MATIKVSQLCPAGSELFQDSESFLNELTDRKIDAVVGGDITSVAGLTVCSGDTVSVASVVVSIRTASLWTLVDTKIVSIKTKATTVGISVTQKTVITVASFN